MYFNTQRLTSAPELDVLGWFDWINHCLVTRYVGGNGAAQTRLSAETRPTALSLKRTAGSQPAIRAGRKVHTSRMRHGAPVRRSGSGGFRQQPAACCSSLELERDVSGRRGDSVP